VIARLLILAALAATPGHAQEYGAGPDAPVGIPSRFGGPVSVNVPATTLLVGTTRVTVTVPADSRGQTIQAGDFVWVVPTGTGISIGSSMSSMAEATGTGQIRITFTTPGLASLSLGTLPVAVRWIGGP